MLEVQSPEDTDMQNELNFLTIKMKTFFVEAPETFFLREKVHFEIFKF